MALKPVPATNFKDLANAAFDAILARPNDLDLSRLRRQARDLANADKGESLQVCAILEAAVGKYAEADALFERAIASSENKLDTLGLHLAVLDATDQGFKIKSLFDANYPNLRNNPSMLKRAQNVLSASGWITSARELDEDLNRLGHPTQTPLTSFFESLRWKDFNESQVAEPVVFARQYLRDRGSAALVVGVEEIPESDFSMSLLYSLECPNSVESASDLEWDLYMAMAEKSFDGLANGLLSIIVVGEAKVVTNGKIVFGEEAPDAH